MMQPSQQQPNQQQSIQNMLVPSTSGQYYVGSSSGSSAQRKFTMIFEMKHSTTPTIQINMIFSSTDINNNQSNASMVQPYQQQPNMLFSGAGSVVMNTPQVEYYFGSLSCGTCEAIHRNMRLLMNSVNNLKQMNLNQRGVSTAIDTILSVDMNLEHNHRCDAIQSAQNHGVSSSGSNAQRKFTMIFGMKHSTTPKIQVNMFFSSTDIYNSQRYDVRCSICWISKALGEAAKYVDSNLQQITKTSPTNLSNRCANLNLRICQYGDHIHNQKMTPSN